MVWTSQSVPPSRGDVPGERNGATLARKNAAKSKAKAKRSKRLQWSNAEAREALERYEGIVRMMARRLRPVASLGQALDEDPERAQQLVIEYVRQRARRRAERNGPPAGFGAKEWARVLELPDDGFVRVYARAQFAEAGRGQKRDRLSQLTREIEMLTRPSLEVRALSPHPLRGYSQVLVDGEPHGERTPFGPGGYDIAALSAGLATEAIREVLAGRLRRAYALSRPPGHHCLPARPMGFSLLANLAIGLEAARAAEPVRAAVCWNDGGDHGDGSAGLGSASSPIASLGVRIAAPESVARRTSPRSAAGRVP